MKSLILMRTPLDGWVLVPFGLCCALTSNVFTSSLIVFHLKSNFDWFIYLFFLPDRNNFHICPNKSSFCTLGQCSHFPLPPPPFPNFQMYPNRSNSANSNKLKIGPIDQEDAKRRYPSNKNFFCLNIRDAFPFSETWRDTR